jgi:hypothetical protein
VYRYGDGLKVKRCRAPPRAIISLRK